MTTIDYEALLTDDELVALAVDAGQRWPAPLPTVAGDDVAQLSAAAARGVRSLLVRGGLEGSEPDARLATIASAAGSDRVVAGYVADAAGAPIGGGVVHAAIGTPSGWLLDEIQPSGLHRFGSFDSDAAVASYFAAVAGVVHAQGLAEEYGEGTVFCVSAVSPTGADVLVVGRGSLIAKTLDDIAAEMSRAEIDVPLSNAVEALVARAGS